ncbi:hypothetical protein AB0H49_24070 [Nocardia sp. NPDC050713]|uniref:SDR family oxidoreductase n=1 Tax=Nocardia sp. NPDC050713 TaxID=3154511 RepID=UPI003403A0BF
MSGNTKHTLVLGGTGKTGGRIVERLRARGVQVRVGSRSAQPPFDWDNPATWAPALLDVEAVYITFQPDLAVPGAPDTVRAFGEMAATAGWSCCPAAARRRRRRRKSCSHRCIRD